MDLHTAVVQLVSSRRRVRRCHDLAAVRAVDARVEVDGETARHVLVRVTGARRTRHTVALHDVTRGAQVRCNDGVSMSRGFQTGTIGVRKVSVDVKISLSTSVFMQDPMECIKTGAVHS